MPVPAHTELRRSSRHWCGFNALYAALLLFSLHWGVVLYLNSTYLAQFVTTELISLLFTFGAALTMVHFLSIAPLLSRFGNVRIAVVTTLIEFLALIGMAYTTTPSFGVILFLIHLAVVPAILFHLDVFMESMIGVSEKNTGGRRGLFLTIMSLTGAIASFAMGQLLGAGTPDFTSVYLVAAALLLPFLYLLCTQKHCFFDPPYIALRIPESVAAFWHIPDIRYVFLAHFLLQVFFSWMVVYTPMYLASYVGFNWEQIGSILFVGLMAYVLLEYPIGVIADRYIGEKEMMAFGFLIMALATSSFLILPNGILVPWMLAMFATRVGASFVETTTESYFFKHTKGKDAQVIGLFRITRPLAYVLGTALGGFALLVVRFEILFLILATLMVPGIFFAMMLHDTR